MCLVLVFYFFMFLVERICHSIDAIRVLRCYVYIKWACCVSSFYHFDCDVCACVVFSPSNEDFLMFLLKKRIF